MSRFEEAIEWILWLNSFLVTECPKHPGRNTTQISVFYDNERDIVVIECDEQFSFVVEFCLENLWRFGLYDIGPSQENPMRLEVSFDGPPPSSQEKQ